MIVLCENCEKKYQIDLEMFKSDIIKYRCRSCNHINTVSKPSDDQIESNAEELPAETEMKSQQTPDADSSIPVSPKKDAGSGRRAKMILLFVIVAIILITVGGFKYLR